MMRPAVERGSFVVSCADFNMVVGALEYRAMMERGGGYLRDV